MGVGSGRSEAAAGRPKVHTPIGNGGHMLEEVWSQHSPLDGNLGR